MTLSRHFPRSPAVLRWIHHGGRENTGRTRRPRPWGNQDRHRPVPGPAQDREPIERAVEAALDGRTGTWTLSVHGSRYDQGTWLVLLGCPDGSRRVRGFAALERDPAIVRATVERDLGTAWMPAGREFDADNREHRAVRVSGRFLPR